MSSPRRFSKNGITSERVLQRIKKSLEISQWCSSFPCLRADSMNNIFTEMSDFNITPRADRLAIFSSLPFSENMIVHFVVNIV